MKRSERITKNEAINLLLNKKLNKFYAGTLSVVDILERLDALRFENIRPVYYVHSLHTDYMNVACDYDEELCRCYFKHTLCLKSRTQGYDVVIFIFENDSRVVYVVR